MNMSERLAPAVGLGLALAGGIATAFLLLRASAGTPISGGILVFHFWVALPFIALCGLNLYCLKASSAHPLRTPAALTTLVVVALSVFIYADAVFNPRSSTAALVFLFLPLWSLLGGTVVLLVSFRGVQFARRHTRVNDRAHR